MTGIAADVQGFEETVAAVLGVLGKIVEYDLASVLMLDDRSTYLTVARETSHAQYAEFFAGIADTASQVTGQTIGVHDLQVRVADANDYLGSEDEGGMATFLSMPLRARGRVVGVLGLSSAVKSAFGETSLNTLRLVEAPAAVVIDNATALRLPAGLSDTLRRSRERVWLDRRLPWSWRLPLVGLPTSPTPWR